MISLFNCCFLLLAELVDIKDTKVQVVPVAPPVPVHLCEYQIGDIVLVHPGETELQRFWVAEVVDLARERDGLLQVSLVQLGGLFDFCEIICLARRLMLNAKVSLAFTINIGM